MLTALRNRRLLRKRVSIRGDAEFADDRQAAAQALRDRRDREPLKTAQDEPEDEDPEVMPPDPSGCVCKQDTQSASRSGERLPA